MRVCVYHLILDFIGGNFTFEIEGKKYKRTNSFLYKRSHVWLCDDVRWYDLYERNGRKRRQAMERSWETPHFNESEWECEREREGEREKSELNCGCCCCYHGSWALKHGKHKWKRRKSCECSCLGVFPEKRKKKKTKLRAANLHSQIDRHTARVFRMPDKPRQFSRQCLTHAQGVFSLRFHTATERHHNKFTFNFFLCSNTQFKLLLQFTVWCCCCCRHCHSLCLCNCEKAPRYQSTILCVRACVRASFVWVIRLLLSFLLVFCSRIFRLKKIKLQ